MRTHIRQILIAAVGTIVFATLVSCYFAGVAINEVFGWYRVLRLSIQDEGVSSDPPHWNEDPNADVFYARDYVIKGGIGIGFGGPSRKRVGKPYLSPWNVRIVNKHKNTIFVSMTHWSLSLDGRAVLPLRCYPNVNPENEQYEMRIDPKKWRDCDLYIDDDDLSSHQFAVGEHGTITFTFRQEGGTEETVQIKVKMVEGRTYREVFDVDQSKG